MKARNNTTRWLLIALLFGFLTAVGLTLVHQHGHRTVAEALHAIAPALPAVSQQPQATVVAATGGKRTLTVPAVIGTGNESADTSDSNSQPLPAARQSDTSADTSAGNAGGISDGAPSHAPPPSNPPAAPATAPQPQSLANGYASNGYAPLDCELPAGCGAPGGNSVAVIRQSSGTSGGVTMMHDSNPTDNTPSTNNTSNPQTNDGGNPPPGNNDQLPADPPGQSHTVASAPELDPATLAGALTLLLGSLAALRGRRVRVTR